MKLAVIPAANSGATVELILPDDPSV